ncbi:MAG: glycosyltransferase family A protein [Patescibacteria group bacterium]|jgi:glycosyltransferase involved in cell wall biosynthesis
MPQISVIIPAYNAAKTISRCLNSIFNQTLKDYEIIVVNDGSTDDLLLALTTCSHRLTILNQENKGAPAARNYGFSQSSGSEVIFVDADVILRPQALEKMHLALKTVSEASFAYSQFRWGWKKFKLWPFAAEKLKQQPYIHTCSLIRREKFPGFDETLKKFQDWDLFLTMAECGDRGVFIPEVLFKVSTGGTMSQWLPSFAYKLPWLKLKTKDKYEKWKKIVQEKHSI